MPVKSANKHYVNTKKINRRRVPIRAISAIIAAICVLALTRVIYVYTGANGDRRTTVPPGSDFAAYQSTMPSITSFDDDINASRSAARTANGDVVRQPAARPLNTAAEGVGTAEGAEAPNSGRRAGQTVEIPVSNWFEPDVHINSANAILMNMESGEILYEKYGTARIYPASMTKIMTAIVALEYIDDLNDMVLLNEAIFQPIYNANAVTAGFLPGERVRAIDLLYGLILPSGAECAVGLAMYAAGSESAFMESMNEKARELGMTGSNFTNPTGLHDNDHYSTALDIAVLFRYALQNETFYEIITSLRHSTPATDRHEGGITYYNTLLSKIDGNAGFEGGMILGGKTGYTGEAGQCLASFAVKDGVKYILVTAGAGADGAVGAIGDGQTQIPHIDDAFAIYAAIPSPATAAAK